MALVGRDLKDHPIPTSVPKSINSDTMGADLPCLTQQALEAACSACLEPGCLQVSSENCFKLGINPHTYKLQDNKTHWVKSWPYQSQMELAADFSGT